MGIRYRAFDSISSNLVRYRPVVNPNRLPIADFGGYPRPIVIEDYNRRAIAALRHAQALSGVRSATSFSRTLAERGGGSPSASAYRRWITGEAVVPAWALDVAAEVVGTTVQDLLDGAEGAGPAVDNWRVEIAEAIGRLEAEMIEVRQHIGLPWRGGDSAAAADEPPSGRARSAS